MYSTLERRLAARVREFLKQQYQVDMPNVVVDQPPNVALGEFALPLSFELAKKLRKAPRKIAEEIVANVGPWSAGSVGAGKPPPLIAGADS